MLNKLIVIIINIEHILYYNNNLKHENFFCDEWISIPMA